MFASRLNRTIACVGHISHVLRGYSGAKISAHCDKFSLPRVDQCRSISLTAQLYQDKSERRYHDSHEWVKIEGNTATIGVTDFAQEMIRNALYIELPEVGLEVTKDDTVSSIESTKAANDVFAPISGKIIAVNEELEDKPELIHRSPYEQGWLFKMEVKDQTEYDKLLTYDDYKKLLEYSKLNSPDRKVIF
ncbi:glycine cleavage system H protein, mitochondrial [Brevipalpus obovatus]|uniref:glycine cleavage system H protein, mitochondrial n=1 Tax=Brevipalpus obovatus TaxID=246614 RepID=UPI003D9EC6D5